MMAIDCLATPMFLMQLARPFRDDEYRTMAGSCEEARQVCQESTGEPAEVIGFTSLIRPELIRHGDLSSSFFRDEPNVRPA